LNGVCYLPQSHKATIRQLTDSGFDKLNLYTFPINRNPQCVALCLSAFVAGGISFMRAFFSASGTKNGKKQTGVSGQIVIPIAIGGK